jgi:DNA topoisomerase VI subunit B
LSVTDRRINPQLLERTAFGSSREAEYFDARQLSALTGVSQDEFANVCLKELIDNALDASETAGVAPEISIDVRVEEGVIQLAVSDNGPGIPPEVVRKVLNYSIRVSDKAAYRSPTRGAQGNALKTIIGIPYSLGVRESIVITARGVRHTINPWIDPAGLVRISHTEDPTGEEEGTSVSLQITPGYDVPENHLQDFQPVHWVRSFAAFNPHATFRYKVKASLQKRPKFTNRPRICHSRSTYPPSPRARIGIVQHLFRHLSLAT